MLAVAVTLSHAKETEFYMNYINLECELLDVCVKLFVDLIEE